MRNEHEIPNSWSYGYVMGSLGDGMKRSMNDSKGKVAYAAVPRLRTVVFNRRVSVPRTHHQPRFWCEPTAAARLIAWGLAFVGSVGCGF